MQVIFRVCRPFHFISQFLLIFFVSLLKNPIPIISEVAETKQSFGPRAAAWIHFDLCEYSDSISFGTWDSFLQLKSLLIESVILLTDAMKLHQIFPERNENKMKMSSSVKALNGVEVHI